MAVSPSSNKTPLGKPEVKPKMSKMPKEYELTESHKKALERASDQKARNAAHKMADALAAGSKKAVKKVKHG